MKAAVQAVIDVEIRRAGFISRARRTARGANPRQSPQACPRSQSSCDRPTVAYCEYNSIRRYGRFPATCRLSHRTRLSAAISISNFTTVTIDRSRCQLRNGGTWNSGMAVQHDSWTTDAQRTYGMATNDYHFITRWRVLGSIEEVYRLISDAPDLPRWWPSVYLASRELAPGDAAASGDRIACTPRAGCRTRCAGSSALPRPHSRGFTRSRRRATSSAAASGLSSRTALGRT